MIFRLERCGMKFAHIGDLHIGKRVHDFSMLEDQRYILDQMIKIFEEQKVDGVLIAGDVYDKTVPSAEAVQLFDEFITGLAKAEIPVYMISGNHDSAERLSFGAKLFESSDIYISQVYDGEMKRIVLKDQYGPISVYAMLCRGMTLILMKRVLWLLCRSVRLIRHREMCWWHISL